MLFSHEIPYQQNSSVFFEKLRHLPWAVYLDSCQPHSTQGRFDIISACPHTTLITRGDITQVQVNHVTSQSTLDPFFLLRQHLIKTPVTIETLLPFCGGAIGYFAYDLGRRLEKLPALAQSDLSIPDMAIGIYDWALVIDHQLKIASLVSMNLHPNTSTIIEEIKLLLSQPTTNSNDNFRLLQPLTSNMSREQYGVAFQKIMHYIRQGDCYQVNLAQRFSAHYSGSPWMLYQQLRYKNPAPYAAYFQIPDATCLSLSPERFLLAQNNLVCSKPMKGTRPRGATPSLDQQLAQSLQSSEKDRAENVMIVDLLRHDLSKVCRIGSVKVPTLFEIETFPAVHQMVSTVVGELKKENDVIDLLRTCFPGGSITGAPKIRAMEIIEELEPHRRALYCGSIGYISHHQQMDVNIAIRTLLCHGNNIYCSAGGALVADSQEQSEYQETLDKIALISKTLQEMTKKHSHVSDAIINSEEV